MAKVSCKFLFSFVYFIIFLSSDILENRNNVYGCQSKSRTGKSLKIFKTYKRRPSSDSSNPNRVVKTLVFPKNYPTAGINNAYLDINSKLSSNSISNNENDFNDSSTTLFLDEDIPSKEPISEDFLLPSQESYEETTITVTTATKMSGEDIDGIKKEGSRNDSDFQEKYVDNLRRRGELQSNGKNEEDNLREIEESPLLVDEGEGSGLYGEKIKHNIQEVHHLHSERNSNGSEYGKHGRRKRRKPSFVSIPRRPINDNINGIPDNRGSNKYTMGFSAVRATSDSQRGMKGRVMLENTFANLNRGWLPNESLFQCHYPGLYFFTFSARGQINRNEYYYDRVKNDRIPSLYDGKKLEDNTPIVIDRRRDRYYYNPGINKANDEWQVTLMLNDVSVLSIGGSNDTTASNSILLPLNARDRVWIELSQGKLVEPYQFTDSQYNGPKKSGYTSFIGYLIGEISQDVISDTIDFEYDDNHNQGPISNQYPHEYYPPDEYYPSGNPDNDEEELIVIDTQRLQGKKRRNKWNKNGPRIVDHRFHNLTPNRREEDEVYFQRTTPRIPSNPKRNRFDSIGDDPGRYDSSSREPLARIAFGKLPYPAGKSELNRRT